MPLQSSSRSSQALRSGPHRRSTPASGAASPWDSVEDLQEPVLPWMYSGELSANASRHSIGSFMIRSSLDSSARESLHVVKRYQRELDEGRKNKRWTKFKWWSLLTNSLLFLYGLGYLLFALLTFLRFYLHADVVEVGEPTVLGLVTATGALCLITSFVGYAGLMLNNRPILAVYNLLLWVSFALITAIGYYSYRRIKWNLLRKLSFQWHYTLSSDGRARLQANLHCCGYKDFTDFHERSNQCFPRTLLPGCRFKYTHFIQSFLTYAYIVAFSTVGVHLFVLISALICANHVNRQFGKHLPPKIYRLDYQGIVAGTPTGSSYNLHQQE